MTLLDVINGLFTKDELPSDVSGPVRVDVRAKIISSNDHHSPLTGLMAAVVVVTILERRIVIRGTSRSGEAELEEFDEVGSVVFGDTLTLEDSACARLIVPARAAASQNKLRAIALNRAGTPIEKVLPPELEAVAGTASGEHMLFFREILFRTDDSVRVRAQVAPDVAVVAQGYRDGLSQALVARPDLAPIFLYEEV